MDEPEEKQYSARELLQRALSVQIELGQNEVILQRRSRQPESIISSPGKMPDAEAAMSIKTSEKVAGRKFESTSDHYRAICECQLCPLGATRNKFVYGVGNTNADLMFIGEAPGRQEDLQGEPFVGRAGQLLDKILAAIQMSRDEIYIANILKCRPPSNRDPQPEEMEKCFPYLLEQIRLIRPRLLCALGRIAAQALLKTTTPLGRLRGQWHEFENLPLLVTYHPAALLRNPAWKKGTWEDVQMLKAKYDQLKG